MSSQSKQRQSKRRRKHRIQQQRAVRGEQRLACSDHHPIHRCLVNSSWREEGKASILLARSIGERRLSMAVFLVDLWAMGLKDAWGRVDMTFQEFEESVRMVHELRMKPLAVETAQHIVYGGVRLAQELGFRLPHRYQRWTAMLGPLPEGVEPDRSLFLKDGRVCLVGSMREFSERLLSTTPEAFLRRPDLEFILEDGDRAASRSDEDDEGCDVDPLADDMEQALVNRVRQWCFASGRVPHRLLPEAVGCLLEALLQCTPDEDFADDGAFLEMAQLDGGNNRLMELIQASDSQEDPAEFLAALEQARDFLSSLDSPEELMETLGLEA